MYYWPDETGSGPYASDLAEFLAERGHSVTVLAGMPHYPAWRTARSYRGKFRMEEEHAGVRVVRRWHTVPRRQSAVRRAAYELSFFLAAVPFRLRSPPDAVIGVVPSISGGMLARLMAARARAAYGLIVHDLVGAAASQSGIAGGRQAASFARRAERWMLARATVVVPVTEAFSSYLVGLGVAPDRIEVLPVWSRTARPSSERQQIRERLGWRDDEIIALHAGNMGLKQGLEQLVDAARLAGERHAPIRFVLMGDGNQRERLESIAAGVEKIDLWPLVDGRQLPDVLAAADALILSERPSVREMSMPSKLTAYFVAGRPVISAVDPAGPTAREIERAGAGRIVPAGEPATLIEALLDVARQGEAIRGDGPQSRRYPHSGGEAGGPAHVADEGHQREGVLIEPRGRHRR